MRGDAEEAFSVAAATRRAGLRRAAAALSGDWSQADDLVQVTLVKLYQSWPLRQAESVDAWLTRTMVRTFIDHTRRPWWRRERAVGQVPDSRAPEPSIDGVGADLLAYLTLLPPRQRACLMLRFVEDYSVEQTAEVLRCSGGTVKSQTSRGLDSIRVHMGVHLAGAPGERRPLQ